MKNLFTSINRYAYRQSENFLTESLAYLLELIRERDPNLFNAFIEFFTGRSLDIDIQNITINTQESTDVGRPDLVISQKLDFTIFIEIKDESGLGPLQMERYYGKLQERESEYKELILLTRSKYSARHVQLDKSKFRHIFWYQISSWFFTNLSRDAVTSYIANGFVAFLEEKNMSLVKINEFEDGVLAMRQLVKLLFIAFTEALPGETAIKTNP